MAITKIPPQEYDRAAELWGASVRATHDFVTEADLDVHALQEFGATRVDVNEQNPRAVGFYQHHGFRTVARSESDPTNKPYPILHMKLTS